jgi:hypothetical protein
MASTIKIACPECDKQIQAPPQVVGKKIRCKACGHTFVARAAGGEVKKSPPAKPKKPDPKVIGFVDDDEDDGVKQYDLTGIDESHRCPFCANAIEEGDMVCLTCGYNLITREKGETRETHDTTAMDWIIWLLPGIACVITILMLITFDVLYCLFISSIFDPETWYGFILCHSGWKMWLVILSLFVIYYCGKFAVKRLILNYTPPEVEKT